MLFPATLTQGYHCGSLGTLSSFTFCHRTIRMIREMTVRTSKARMTEMMTTLNGKATTITGTAVRLLHLCMA